MLDAIGGLSDEAVGELSYLKPYEGLEFDDGLPPVALAYAYYKRAQVVQARTGRKHPALAPTIVDSRPGLVLESWGEEEWERGRRGEIAGFGMRAPWDRAELEGVTARVLGGGWGCG